VVHIDLEGDAQGPLRPDQSQPLELNNPIHLETSGLVFNQRTGIAKTDERIDFRTHQASGSAQGAIYDSGQATLTLKSSVEFHADGVNPANIRAASATITRTPYQAVLQSVQIQRPTGQVRCDRLAVLFRENNTVDRVIATGNVQTKAAGASNTSAAAQRAEASVTERGRLEAAVLSGGVSFTLAGASNMQGSAGSVALHFQRGSIDAVVARNAVHLVQAPALEHTSKARRTELTAPEVAFDFKGSKLSRAVVSGASEMVFTEPGAGGRTAANAGRLVASFGEQGEIRRVTGSGKVRIEATRPGQPDRLSTSDTAEVELTPAGAIATLVQSGHFEYREGMGLARATEGQKIRVEQSAFAQQARFVAADDRLVLTGSPRIEQGGISTTAQRILLSGRRGEAVAEGDVKTTYSQLKQQPGGALLAASAPVHVTAASMTATESGGVAVYRGTAQFPSQSGGGQGLVRLWQGANAIQAPVIEFRSKERTVLAKSGGVQEPGGPGVSTILVQQDRAGKATPVRISARSLSYVDSERRIRFEGNVEIHAEDSVVEAAQVDAYLQRNRQTAGGSPSATGGPSEIERVVASEGVLVQQGERRATGDSLVYTAENKKFVMKGQPASIFDAERGKITADSLTFYSRNDTVQVEGGSSPSVTQTRVAK
jgi:lipopolysaccharide export system protein LptA